MTKKLNDWSERVLGDRGRKSWCVSKDHKSGDREIEVTLEGDHGEDYFVWLKRADLVAMLESVRVGADEPGSTPPRAARMLAIKERYHSLLWSGTTLYKPHMAWLIGRVEELEEALRTVRPADPAPGAEGLLRGDWQKIKEVLL